MSPNSIIVVSILLTVAVKLSISAPVIKATTTQVITYEQFLAIPIGCTRDQITQYMNNNPGEVAADTMFTLTNNKLTTKAQSGINQNQYPISSKQFGDIKTGMSSAEVTSLVGNAGQILAQSVGSIEIVGYTGSTNSYSVVQITYLQDKVMTKVEVGL